MKLFVDRVKELGYALIFSVIVLLIYIGGMYASIWLLTILPFDLGVWIVVVLAVWFALWIVYLFVYWLILEPIRSTDAYYKWKHRHRK